MRVAFSARSRQDMFDIAEYIAEDNPDRALTFFNELEEACLALGDRPLRFPQLDGFASHYRRRVYGNYLIIYRVDEAVTVMRIVSGFLDRSQLVLGD